jgi:hypothetical protein
VARALVERDRAGDGDVERFGGTRGRDRRDVVRLFHDLVGKPVSFGSEDERDLAGEVELVQRRGAVRDERHPRAGSVVEREQRNPKDRARRCSEGFRTERIGAAL